MEKVAPTTKKGVICDRYLLDHRGFLYLFIYSAAVRVVSIPAWQFLPLLVRNHFGGDAIHLGIMSSAFGFGTIAGGAALGIWGGLQRRIVTSWVGLLTPANAFWLAACASVFFGVVFSIYMGPARAIIQATVPPDMQGRIFTIYGSAFNIATPIGLALFGVFGDVIGTNTIFVLGGASLLFFHR